MTTNDTQPTGSLERMVRLEEVRNKLAALREEIAKIRREDKLWEGWLSPCEGGITCVLVACYGAVCEMRRHHEKWNQPNR